MKIKIMRAALQDGLKRLQSIPAAKQSMQILENVKMTAEGRTLTLMATDLDITEVTPVECEIMEGGATTLPLKLLFSVVQKLPEGSIDLTVDGDERAVVHAGSSVFNMNGMTAYDYPNLPKDDEKPLFKIGQKEFKDLIRKTAFAVSTDGTRRALVALNVTVEEAGIVSVATDGRRLAKCENEIAEPYSGKHEMLLGRKIVAQLLSSLGNDGEVEVCQVGSQICFRMGNGTQIYTKVVDEAYPNYKQVIPDITQDYTEVTVDRSLLASIVDRVSVMASGIQDRLGLHFGNDALGVECSSSEAGSAAKDTMAIKYEGHKVDIFFDPNLLMDGLKACDDDEIKIHVRNGSTPMLISCSTPWLYLLMPLRNN